MNQVSDTTAKHNPWPLYIIIGMVAFVLVSGYLLSPRTEEGKLAWINLLGTTNNGILLNPPTQVVSGQILDDQGQDWGALEDNTWKLLVLSPNGCLEACQNRLAELHAMRIRLNRDASRLTIGLLTNPHQGATKFIDGYDDINNLNIGAEGLLLKLESTNMPALSEGPVTLLMNPVDVFMMAYGSEHTGIDILADFEHLLDLAH